MATDRVTFDAHYSTDLFEQAALMFRDYRFECYGRLLIAAYIVDAVGFGVLLWVGAKSAVFVFIFGFIVFGAPIWFCYAHFLFPSLIAGRLQRLLPQPTRVSVDEESICFVLRGREVAIPWSDLNVVLEAETLFLLMRSPFGFLVLPKGGLPLEAYGLLHQRSRSRAA